MNKISDKELLVELKRRFEKNKQTINELEQLTKELKLVNQKLEESESLKSHFISNIANEIVNPFTSILALSKNILSVKKEDWKKVITMISLIHSEAFNLDFQLRNIFVAAKIEAGEIYPEIINVDVKTLVKNVIDSFRIDASKKKLKIELSFDEESSVSELSHFKTDAEKLKLILSNILSNAIKFSYEKNKIIIKVWYDKSSLYFSVKDFGPGLSKENQQIIFDRFKRIDSGIGTFHRGHGLGLSVNKAVLDLLSGKINIDTDIGKGALFTISIPESQTDIAGFSATGNDFIFINDNSETF